MKITDYLDYRKYLNDALAAAGKKSGIKARAAQAIHSLPAYLSRVLSGQADLSLEQADNMSHFLLHDPEERHYFLLLVQKERAGSASLKAYFSRQIEKERSDRQIVSRQVSPTEVLSAQAESRYYSSWIYGAIHVLLSIDNLRTPAALANALQVPLYIVSNALKFLTSQGLATEAGGHFKVGPSHIHLKSDSEHISRHHANWRLMTMERLTTSAPLDIHYSAVATLDEETASLLRENIVQALKSNLKQIEKAPAKTAYVYNIDFFEIVRT